MLTALVTGASRGIGAGIATQLAQRQVRVIAHGKTRSAPLTQLVASLPNPTLNHVALAADLTDANTIEPFWQQVVAATSTLDILINNAGIYLLHDMVQTDTAQWDAAFLATLQANLLTPALLTQRVTRHMLTQSAHEPFGRGRIVNISSRGAFRGEPQAPGYGAAKAGLNAFGQSLAQALAPQHIYTYTIAPGWVATDMANPHLDGPMGAQIKAQHPLGRVASVAELANLAIYCALDAPATMTGCVIDINGASYLRT